MNRSNLTDTEVLVDGARSARLAGDLVQSAILIERAERSLDPKDLNGLVELWSAISMERLGDFEPDVRQEKSFKYLSMLAEVGNIPAQETLMIDFLEGLNGVPKNIEQFLYWNQRARESGSKLAEAELKRYKSHKKNLSRNSYGSKP